ncbi:hypothetical protein ACHAWX_006331 [Stephanocyclus meneghinianus]
MFSQYIKTIVTIPPGRVGIHLQDSTSDVSSTIVTAVSPSSPLAGKVVQGDSIISVNGVDVRKMDTSSVLRVFELHSQVNKIITFLHKSPNHEEDVALATELDSKPTQWREEIISMPPGRIGIHLEDFVSGVSNTVVTSVSPRSALAGKVFPGDSIIRVNGVDVHKMDTLRLFEVFQKYSEEEKVVTIARKKIIDDEEEMVVGEEALSMDSEPTQSSKSSNIHDSMHSHHKHQSDSSHKSATSSAKKQSKRRQHHAKKEHANPSVSKSHLPPAKGLTIEIINDDVDDGNPLSYPNSMERKGGKDENIVRLASTSANDEESPLPPDVFDRSLSETSSFKQKIPGMTRCPTKISSPNVTPIPVGFVFDDSASNNTKLYGPESNTQNPEGSIQDENHPRFPPSSREVPIATDSNQDEMSTITMSTNHQVSQPSRHNYWDEYLSATSQLQEAASNERQHSFDSSDSSKDTEQESTNDQYEIVADAVVVNDPEIYDAELINDAEPPNEELRSPNIVINNMYAPPDDELKDRQRVWWRSTFSLQILILVVIIVGSGLIIMGIVLGVKKSPSENAIVTNNVQSSNESTQVKDDHRQISNIFYNMTTNHYIIEYKNGTKADAVRLSYSWCYLREVFQFFQLSFMYIKGAVLPEYLNEAMIEEGRKSTSTSTTTPIIKIDSPLTPTSNLFDTEAELIVEETASPTTSGAATTTFYLKTTPASATTTEMPDVASTTLEPGGVSSTATNVLTTEMPSPVHVSGNDRCEDAISLRDLPAYRAGTTLTATPDFTSELEQLCGTTLESKGVWYSFESDKRRIVRLEYELKLQGIGDSVLSIFTGSCAAGSLSCVTSVTGAADYYYGGNNAFAIYEFLSEVGESYLFLLSGASGDTAGGYEFRVTEHEIPSNDVCENATVIVTVPRVPIILKGDTTGATPDFDDTNVGIRGCAGMDWYTRGLWYQLIGKGTNVRLEYHMYSIGLGNSELSIFTGTCGDLLCHGNSEGAANNYYYSYNDMASYEFYAEKGETYSFLLYGADFNTASEFEFKVTEYEVPSNDMCSQATEVTVSSSTPFVEKGLSTLGATPDFDDSSIHTCVVDWYTRGVWYRIIGHGAVVRIEYQLYSAGMGNSELAIFTGSCESLSCYDIVEGAANYYGGGNNELAAYEFIADDGQTYFVWVSGENFDAAAMYDLTVSEYDIPSNDKCENATSISASSVYSGTTAGSTPDFNAFDMKCGGSEDNRGVWYSFTGNGKLTYFTYTPMYVDTQLSLFGGNCDNLKCEGNYGSETSFSFVPVSGKQYRLFLAGSYFYSVGDYSLSMEQYDRPSNDACVNAVKMTSFPYTISGNMKGATPDFNNETVLCGEDPLYSGVWYSFAGTGKEVSLELKTAGTASDFWGEIAVFQGDCGTFACIIQEETQGENAIVTAIVPSVAGTKYKVLIAAWGLPTYDVSFQFSASAEKS